MSYPTTGITGRSLAGKIESAGVISVCLACFFTPLSTSLLALFSLLAVVFWLLSGRFLSLRESISCSPSVVFALSLFLLMCFAITYSPVEPLEAVQTLKKYRELILLPVVISLLASSKERCDMAENSFLTGCVVLLVVSYGMAFEIIPGYRYGNSLVFHITHSFFMAVLAYWALHRTADSHQYRYLWLVIFLAASINLFYIAPGRTGMLVYLALMSLFLVQRFSLARCCSGFLAICTLLALVYFTSDNFSGRTREVIDEIQHYQPGNSRSSIGQRFDWWLSSFELIRQEPILGHGTGSFATVHARITAPTGITPTDNPHNEYLLIAVQTGLTGLLLFLALLLSQVLCSRSLPEQKRMLLQGVVMAMVSGSLANSLLFDSQQGHFYLFMSAVFMAAKAKKPELTF